MQVSAAECTVCGLGVQEVLVHLCGGAQPSLPKTAVQSGTPTLLEAVMRRAPEAADWMSSHPSLLSPQLSSIIRMCVSF